MAKREAPKQITKKNARLISLGMLALSLAIAFVCVKGMLTGRNAFSFRKSGAVFKRISRHRRSKPSRRAFIYGRSAANTQGHHNVQA